MVAIKFTTSRRRDTLSFKHHAEVVALPDEQADALAEETSRRRDVLSFSHHAEVAALPAAQADELCTPGRNYSRAFKDLAAGQEGDSV